jgi:hypothetical protein
VWKRKTWALALPAAMAALAHAQTPPLVANRSLLIDAATFSADGQWVSGQDLSIALTQDVANHAELAAKRQPDLHHHRQLHQVGAARAAP